MKCANLFLFGKYIYVYNLQTSQSAEMSTPSVDAMLKALGWKFDAAAPTTDAQIYKLKLHYLINVGFEKFFTKHPEKYDFGVAYVYITHEVPAPWGIYTAVLISL